MSGASLQLFWQVWHRRGTSRSAVTGATSWRCHVRSWGCVPASRQRAGRHLGMCVRCISVRLAHGDKHEGAALFVGSCRAFGLSYAVYVVRVTLRKAAVGLEEPGPWERPGTRQVLPLHEPRVCSG